MFECFVVIIVCLCVIAACLLGEIACVFEMEFNRSSMLFSVFFLVVFVYFQFYRVLYDGTIKVKGVVRD